MVRWVEHVYVARRVCLSSFRALTSIQRVREGSPLSSRTGTPASNGQRAAAVERLKAAVAERKQVRDETEANGTGGDIEAAVTVKAADEQVDARQRWLAWVDRDKE